MALEPSTTRGGAVGLIPLSRVLLAAALLAGCGSSDEPTPTPPPAPGAPAVKVDEAFHTEPLDPDLDDLDSPAVWHGPAGEHWLLVTAKAAGAVVLYDATTGTPIGAALRHLLRPNGILVLDDRAFVVERDGRRVRVVALPQLITLGTFGEEVLVRPYGIGGMSGGERTSVVWVTDGGDAVGGAGRVHRFRVDLSSGRPVTEHDAFGDTGGPGPLQRVESIVADPGQRLVAVADEAAEPGRIVLYDLDGRFTGRTFGEDHFLHEAEGFALVACGEGGFWIAADQDPRSSAFHVFGRASLRHLGTFRGRRTANTDGVAFSPRALAGRTRGAFYAVDDDRRVSAFAWAEVAAALGLPACAPSD